MGSPSEIIGPAAVKALQDAGYTLVPPKEPARLVLQNETLDRWRRLSLESRLASGTEDVRTVGDLNAADDWLVKTVNKRIIEGLGRDLSTLTYRVLTSGNSNQGYSANRADLLRLFCGEEK